tara:strand:- start:198 stop:596 length:399 start_codon:yes stop_codon:yes gene_type:complete
VVAVVEVMQVVPVKLVDLVVVVLGMEEMEELVLHKHLLMEFHRLLKVTLVVLELQAVINLALCLVVEVVLVPLVKLQQEAVEVEMVVLDCQILLELVHLFSMPVVAVVEDTQALLTVQVDKVEVVMLDHLLV